MDLGKEKSESDCYLVLPVIPYYLPIHKPLGLLV